MSDYDDWGGPDYGKKDVRNRRNKKLSKRKNIRRSSSKRHKNFDDDYDYNNSNSRRK